MVAIELRFLTGQFHATPWGRHVNEGAVEWPPSPWRLLRALLAVWHRKCSDIPEATLRALIDKLTALPDFHLPPASVGHTRQYMPTYRTDQHKTDMVFDTFVTVCRDTPVVFLWPDVALDGAEAEALRALLDSLSYFGRAESWVEAVWRDNWDGAANCGRAGEGGEDLERVPVLTAVRPEEYAAWRDEERGRLEQRVLAEKRAKALAKGKDADGVKWTKGDQEKLAQCLPADLLGALRAETTDLRKQGWSHPPGARTVHYLRARDALEARPAPRARTTTLRPTVARYALRADVLPSLTRALTVGELMRRALMGLSGAAPVFAGKDADGGLLTGHQHAYILPADDDNDGRLDHIVVYCREGFSPEARRTLGSLKRLRGREGDPELGLVLTSLGDPQSLGGTQTRRDETPLLAKARVWESRTPFVLVRHPKCQRDGTPKLREDGAWIDGPEDQLRRELAARGFPEPQSVEARHSTMTRTPEATGGHELRWLHFRRERRSGRGKHGPSGAFGFRIEFEQPISGPLALGHGAHFGLGQFVAGR